MSKLTDHHPMPQPPPESTQLMKAMAEADQADPNGATARKMSSSEPMVRPSGTLRPRMRKP